MIPASSQESDDRGMLWRLRLPVLALTLLLALPAIAQAGPPPSAIFFYFRIHEPDMLLLSQIVRLKKFESRLEGRFIVCG